MKIVQLDIKLAHVRPVVSRRLEVPLTLRLDRLHLAIQVAMGWTNSHLYLFEAKGVTWTDLDPEYSLDFSDDLPADNARIIDVLEETGVSSFHYVYDFGDHWEHEIRVGKVSSATKDVVYPLLIDGKNRCPPEDVGGVPGYHHFLDTLKNPLDPERNELLEWVGESDFDPNKVDLIDHGIMLRKLAGSWGHISRSMRRKPQKVHGLH